jgi:hypothetical protein
MRCFGCCLTPNEEQLFEAVRDNNPLLVHRLLRKIDNCLRMEVDNVGSTLLHVAGQVRAEPWRLEAPLVVNVRPRLCQLLPSLQAVLTAA